MHTLKESREQRDKKSLQEQREYLFELFAQAEQIAKDKCGKRQFTEKEKDRIESFLRMTEISRSCGLYSYATSCLTQVVAEIDI